MGDLETEVWAAIVDGQKGLPIEERLTIEQAQSHIDATRLYAYAA